MNNPNLKLALEYIASHDMKELSVGRHEIDGDNVFVNIVEAELHTCDAAKYEVHDCYIDIHLPISAPESYGVMPRKDCKLPVGHFDEKDDYQLYDDKVEVSCSCQPGEYVVFAPSEAHAPLIGTGSIRKAIFKVRV